MKKNPIQHLPVMHLLNIVNTLHYTISYF
jgi:hypothetical protein